MIKTRRKHKTKTERNRTTTEQLEEKHKKQQTNTGFPAHEPPRKINFSKGLAGRFLCFFSSAVYVVLCFPLSFYVVCCCYMCFFDCKCKNIKILGENSKTTERHRQQKHKNSKENINNKTLKQNRKNTNLPARPLDKFIFRGGSWAGNHVFMCFLFSLELFCCFSVSFCLFMFSPSLFKFLHLQSKKHI